MFTFLIRTGAGVEKTPVFRQEMKRTPPLLQLTINSQHMYNIVWTCDLPGIASII